MLVGAVSILEDIKNGESEKKHELWKSAAPNNGTTEALLDPIGKNVNNPLNWHQSGVRTSIC